MFVVLSHGRYSNKINLPSFADLRKFKIDNETLNKYQKPVLLFMKHITMWALEGSIIIDVTSGTRTTGVCTILYLSCTLWYMIYFLPYFFSSGRGFFRWESELFEGQGFGRC